MGRVNKQYWGVNAAVGDFIKDQSLQCRSLGHVMDIDMDTNMMRVKFPKIKKISWIVWENRGHYIVV